MDPFYIQWKLAYSKYLKEMFEKIILPVNKQQSYDSFCLFVYNNSSKYISSYT